MSSPPKELKAGHPPAVKAGGMRITQHKSPKSTEVKLNDEEIINPLKPPQASEKAISISGAPSHGNRDFPAEAVQSFHQKPQPSHEQPHTAKPMNIQQPRK
ncbi:death-associated protein [Nesidiocoris tenuis]|uniref:Death-associated protein n=1 Tax=Nesidiocoris tenuis TaxID=355587 RepID=A0ABN7B6B8_9HEMI|nr:death-associated protein [Nesidiocoris tenuis]